MANEGLISSGGESSEFTEKWSMRDVDRISDRLRASLESTPGGEGPGGGSSLPSPDDANQGTASEGNINPQGREHSLEGLLGSIEASSLPDSRVVSSEPAIDKDDARNYLSTLATRLHSLTTDDEARNNFEKDRESYLRRFLRQILEQDKDPEDPDRVYEEFLGGLGNYVDSAGYSQDEPGALPAFRQVLTNEEFERITTNNPALREIARQEEPEVDPYAEAEEIRNQARSIDPESLTPAQVERNAVNAEFDFILGGGGFRRTEAAREFVAGLAKRLFRSEIRPGDELLVKLKDVSGRMGVNYDEIMERFFQLVVEERKKRGME